MKKVFGAIETSPYKNRRLRVPPLIRYEKPIPLSLSGRFSLPGRSPLQDGVEPEATSPFKKSSLFLMMMKITRVFKGLNSVPSLIREKLWKIRSILKTTTCNTSIKLRSLNGIS